MYQALYRKWRPRTFEDVIGQEPITTTLKNEIRQGKPAHAYLLMGSRGTGKTTCAKLIAKAVNCLQPNNGSPCGRCEICTGIDNGSLVDVVEIDAASNNGVDNIRDLREEAGFLPAVARYRVYIIDEAHMLSMGAVNALLKIMEEPPEHVIFILATTEVHKIPATIQSRCQRFDFRRIETSEIAAHLMNVASEEKIHLDAEAAELIARLADGGMRDALSILDLSSSHSDQITVETVSKASGLVGQDYLFDLADAICAQDLSAALELLDEVGASVEYDRICTQLISHLRNLMVASVSRTPEKLIVCLPETLERYRAQCKDYPLERILYAIRLLQDTQAAMTRTASRRTLLETALIKLCNPKMDASPDALLVRLNDLEARLNQLLANGVPAVQVQQTEKEQLPAPQQESLKRTLPLQEESDAADKRRVSAASPAVEPFERWEEVLERLSTINPAVCGVLAGTSAYLSGKRVLIDSDNPIFLEMMRSNDYTKNSLKDAIMQVTGVKYGIGPYSAVKPEAAQKTNPLSELADKARALGIPVTEG